MNAAEYQTFLDNEAREALETLALYYLCQKQYADEEFQRLGGDRIAIAQNILKDEMEFLIAIDGCNK